MHLGFVASHSCCSIIRSIESAYFKSTTFGLENRRAGDDMSESNSPCQSIEIATWEIVAAKDCP